MAGMDREISEQYDLRIRNIIPLRDEYILDTSAGKKVLKRSSLSPGRIIFIHEVKEHLFKNGFTNIDRFIQTSSKSPYIIKDQECYTLTDMIDGSEYVMDEENKAYDTAAMIASMHKASVGFVPSANCVVRKEIGKLPTYYEKRLKELRRLKKLAEKRKTQFDILYMDHVDRFYQRGELALERLLKSSYSALAKEAINERLICHNDFSYHNILLSHNKLYLTNFNHCCVDLKLQDIYSLIRNALKRCKSIMTCSRLIVEGYRTVNDISEDEMEIIRIMLLFPQKFWRISNRYYNCRSILAGGNYLERLEEAVSETQLQTEFVPML